jgi:hypothetical protein
MILMFLCSVSVTFTVMVPMCVAVLQDCPKLLDSFMTDSAVSFPLSASRMTPDKKIKSIVRVKLSLI